ncbi:MAG: lipoyl synthase [FCB group bacterium]|nr:lipoyl synthase [FCB group bacterium]
MKKSTVQKLNNKNITNAKRKPDWLKVSAFYGEDYKRVNGLLQKYHLNTVCQAANCPNRGECFNRGTATFLILGPVCTRNCRFCDIAPGKPRAVDTAEPLRLAQMVKELKLKHVVITSVTRDDLPDGGANQFAQTVKQLRKIDSNLTIEILTPDFKNEAQAKDIIIACRPDVFNHNVETVPRLYPSVRPQADYQRSLALLKYIADNSSIITKSGLMVGLGETMEELQQVFEDLTHSLVSILTIGQYLAPSKEHLPVVRYLHPDEFLQLEAMALKAGIKKVFSAPLVRSSYKADLFSLAE